MLMVSLSKDFVIYTAWLQVQVDYSFFAMQNFDWEL